MSLGLLPQGCCDHGFGNATQEYLESDMSEATVRSLAMPRTRSVTYRTRGRAHGPIVRLMSPSDLGEVLKPFVFLDLFEADMGRMRDAMPVHPHSGIATITVFTEGDVRFEDLDAGQRNDGLGWCGMASGWRGGVAWSGTLAWIVWPRAGLPALGRPAAGVREWPPEKPISRGGGNETHWPCAYHHWRLSRRCKPGAGSKRIQLSACHTEAG